MSAVEKESQFAATSWAGDLPKAWSEVHLRWLARLYAGGTPDKSKDEYWADGTIPWINSGAVNQGLVTEPSAYISQAGFDRSSARWVPEGALVMALAGQGKTKGMVAQMGFSATCNQSMAAIVPSSINARFLFYWLTANYRRIRSGASDDLRDGLNLQMLGDIPCPVPPTNEEQAHIANFLDDKTARIDALIAEKEGLLKTLVELRTSVIWSAVTGQSHAKRQSLLGAEWSPDIPIHWKVTPVGRFARLQRGFDLPDELRTEGNVAVMSGGGVSGWHNFAQVKGPGVVTGRYGTIGVLHYVEDDFWPLNTSLYVSDFFGNNEKYAYYVLSFLPWEMLGGKSAVPGVNRNDVHPLLVGVPPRTEQDQIVLRLDAKFAAFEKVMTHATQHIARLREYRSSLISSAVTGQINVETKTQS